MATHRYWRLYYLSNGGTDDYASMQEIELRDTASGSDLTGSGTASASYYADGAAANLVDNNASTHWGAYSQVNENAKIWWAYDFGAGNAYDIIEIAITSRATYFYESPSIFFWQYSDDGSAWYNAAFISGISWTSQCTQVIDVSPNITATDYDDDFTGADSSSPNTDKWTLTNSPDIQSNTVEITHDGTEEAITSKYTFSGDYCVLIDFNIPSPPATESYGCELRATIDSTHLMLISASRYGGGNKFTYSYYNGGGETYNSVARSNSSGKLMAIRSGNNFSVYKVDGSGSDFVNIGPSVAIGSGTVTIKIANKQWDTNPTITCQYDNYKIIGVTILWTPAEMVSLSVVDEAAWVANAANYRPFLIF